MNFSSPSTIQNFNAMDDSEIGALILEAGASENLKKLKEIKRKVADDKEFRMICDEYSDFSTGRTVLHLAAEKGNLPICKFLIKTVGVYIDALTYKRDTALILAAEGEHFTVVEYLIKQGATIDSSNTEGTTALSYAVVKDNKELMELLVRKGARVNTDCVYGTPLQTTASRGDVEAVKFLLSHDAKPNIYFIVLESPLVCAIKSRSFECFDVLLKAKADPMHHFTGFSPLLYAAKDDDTRFLKTLLDAKAEPNPLGQLKPIEEAALARNRKGVEILLPRTKPLQDYPEWTVDCIMKYCHTEEAKKKREEKRSVSLAALDKGGHAAVSRRHYSRAVIHFRMANVLDPSNAKWASKRSLCHAHGDRRALALHDVGECLRLEPRLPMPHHGDADAAAQIYEKFFMAGLAFTMDPLDCEIDDEFRVAFFDYFAWLYLMSSPEEIVGFTEEAKIVEQ